MKKITLKGSKRLLVIGLVVAYMCMATACTRNDNGDNNSGNMAGTQTENGTGTNTGTANQNNNGTANQNNNGTANGTTNGTSNGTSNDNANGTNNTTDGNDSVLDGAGNVVQDAGDAVGNVVEDAANGVSDVTQDLVGGGNQNNTTGTSATQTNP